MSMVAKGADVPKNFRRFTLLGDQPLGIIALRAADMRGRYGGHWFFHVQAQRKFGGKKDIFENFSFKIKACISLMNTPVKKSMDYVKKDARSILQRRRWTTSMRTWWRWLRSSNGS